MIFKMDTDAVRAMAARFRSAADTIEMGSTATNRNVQGAPWQSQAREEFVLQMDMLNNSIRQSAEILRLMGTAAEQKASQWEAIGDRFNGPWQAMGNAWGQLKSMMGGLWSRIKGAISGIRWPSVPKFLGGVAVGVGVSTFSPLLVVGGLYVLNPDWFQKQPDWWPFGNKQSNAKSSGGGEGGSGGGSWGDTDKIVDGKSDEEVGEITTSAVTEKKEHEIQYDGSEPAHGMDSIKGKPGQWQLDPVVKSDISNREANLYEDVINQFAVEENSRYDNDGHTYCNTFAGDVARAMGVPFPKKNEYTSQNCPSTIGFNEYKGGRDLWSYFTGNDQPRNAQTDGWSELNFKDLSTLESHVNSGKMAIAITYYPTKDGKWAGHISVIKPNQTINNFESIAVASAGSKISNNSTIGEQFGGPINIGYPPKIFIVD